MMNLIPLIHSPMHVQEFVERGPELCINSNEDCKKTVLTFAPNKALTQMEVLYRVPNTSVELTLAQLEFTNLIELWYCTDIRALAEFISTGKLYTHPDGIPQLRMSQLRSLFRNMIGANVLYSTVEADPVAIVVYLEVGNKVLARIFK